MGAETTSPYTSFLIRCWTLDDRPRRIQVEHIQSGEHVQVSSLAAALTWLSQQWNEEPASPSEPEEANGAPVRDAPFLPITEMLGRVKVITGTEAAGMRTRYYSRFIDPGTIDDGPAVTARAQGRALGRQRHDLIHGRRIAASKVRAIAGPEQPVGIFWNAPSQARDLAPFQQFFPEGAVLMVPFGELLKGLRALPRELYVFEPNMEWTLVFTGDPDTTSERIMMRSS